MKVVFMGTPDFAVGTLKALIESEHEIAAVVTQPDKPKGRSREPAMPPVKEVALAAGLTVYQPVKVREESFMEILKGIAPDVIVVVAFGQLLPKAVLEIPRYGCVNVHASLLPKYRGAAPIQQAVIDGEEYSGVTTMQMAAGLDTGDILMQSVRKLDAKETGGSLFDKLSVDGAALLIETLKAIENNTITRTPQNDAESSYVGMLDKNSGKLDFSRDAKELECLIRGLNPWPSAFTSYNGKMLKIWDADVVEGDYPGFECGQVVFVGRDDFIIKCGKNALAVKDLQLEGKKRMDSKSFLLGNRINVGESLWHNQ